jgi:hypothetical protein
MSIVNLTIQRSLMWTETHEKHEGKIAAQHTWPRRRHLKQNHCEILSELETLVADVNADRATTE